MAHGVTQHFTATFASGASVTSDIAMGRGYSRVYVDITSGPLTSVHFQAAGSILGQPGTYRQVKYPVASGLSAPQTITVGTATSGSWVEVPLGAAPYLKVAAPGGVADGGTIKIIASEF
jgi:hypothetical protein